MDEHTNTKGGGAAGQVFMRRAGFLGAGALLAVGAALIGASRGGSASPAPGPVALWATDRDAHELYGLDENLVITRSVQLGWPLLVRACTGGGVWVLRSGNSTSNFGHRLDRLTRAGDLVTEITIGISIDLDTLDGGDALVIELGGGANGASRALRFGREGSLYVLLERSGLTCISDSRSSAVVGTDDGRVLRLDPDRADTILDSVLLGGEIGDIARGPEPGSLWVLDVTGNRKLFLLDPDLSVRWSASVGLKALHVAPVPGEERVWLADTTEPIVRRLGPAGAIEIHRSGLALLGLDRALAWGAGGVLLAAPGGILHLDAAGQTAPGQGGFNFLIDLEPVR